ncbi:hypothetical protein O181_029116 [Austropuccinia psidii MF-1]|uniref:Uncharacterized protein n=1 Tax=Austropuccinia psidii MF-1 TaxID=1389203 RepID=A0A9Q3H307_9BASI|nr:hypothetical protein [Austropuccinia psidii MF-1]
MKEVGHVSLYITNSRILFSRIGDWGEIVLIQDSGWDCHTEFWINWPPILEELTDMTLELDTRNYERKKKKIHNQEKKPEASKSSSSHPQNSPSSNQKRDKPHSSLLNKDFKVIASEKERRIKDGLCTYCGGKHSHESCFKRPHNKLAQPSGKYPSQGKA